MYTPIINLIPTFILFILLVFPILSFGAESNPLHDASKSGNIDTVTSLLNEATPVDTLDSDGRSPLMLACEAGHYEVCNKLIMAGANVFLQDKELNTPLHYAVKQTNTECITLLLNTSASPFTVNMNGKTPLDVATDNNNVAAIGILQSYSMSSSDGTLDLVSQAMTILADPNTIIANLRKYPELGPSIQKVQKSFAREENTWVSRNLSQRSRLSSAVQNQVCAELQLVIDTANAIDANNIATTTTETYQDWKARYTYISKVLRDDYRNNAMMNNTGTTSRRSRTTQRRSSRTTDTMQTMYTEPDPQEAEYEQAASAWKQTTSDNRETLIQQVKDEYLNAMMSSRSLADEEKHGKLLAVIDVLMLNRTSTLDKIEMKILERRDREAYRNSRMQDTGMGTTRTRRR